MKTKMFKKITSVALCVCTALSMTTAVIASVSAAETEGKGTFESSSSYLTEEQYEQLGFDLGSAEQKDQNPESDPLEDYEVSVLSEFYISQGNYGKDYYAQGNVVENLESYDDFYHLEDLSDGDSNEDYLLTQTSYRSNDSNRKYQSSDTDTIKLGDLSTDEYIPDSVVVNSVYVDNCGDSYQEIVLYTYDNENLVEQGVYTEKISDDDFVESIELQESGGYHPVTTGDFDGDNYNEIATYICCDDNPYVGIFECNYSNSSKKYELKLSKKISLPDIDSHYSVTDGRNRPLVSLNTTDISGKDDIVISVSLPWVNDSKTCYNGGTYIYSFDGNKFVQVYSNSFSDDSTKTRMKFSSTEQMDVDGDTVDELVVSGFKNTGYSNGSSKGDMSTKEYLVNMIVWNSETNKYETVWDTSKSISSQGHVRTDKDYLSPIVMTGTQFSSQSNKDTLFVEGVFYDFNSTSRESSIEYLRGGQFDVSKKMSTDSDSGTGKDDGFFISAESGSFVSTEQDRLSEQTIIISGHEYNSNHDLLYIDVYFYYKDTNGNYQYKKINNYFEKVNEDDYGTCLKIMPIDVDNDSVYFKLEETTYGWSNPQILSVVLSPTYWDELDYGDSINGNGCSSYSITSGVDSTYTTGGQISLGVSFGVGTEMTVLGNGGSFGVNLGVAMDSAVEKQTTKSHSCTKQLQNDSNGEDMVVLMVLPIATYNYEFYYPDESEPENVYVNVQLTPQYSMLSLDKYNSMVREYNLTQTDDVNKLPVIDMTEICPGYTVGDPSTYFSENEIPTNYKIEDGHFVPDYSGDEIGENGISGTLTKASEDGTMLDGNTEETLTVEEGRSTGTGYSGTLGFTTSLSNSVKGGIDIGIVSCGGELSFEKSSTLGVTGSYTKVNNDSISYSMTFVGTSNPDYKLSVNMVVWESDECGSSVTVHPNSIIFPTVESVKYPLYLPDDLHISQVTDTSVTLEWTNPDYTLSPFKERKPDSYEIYMNSSGNVESYSKRKTVSSDTTSVTIDNLIPGQTYSFRMKSVKGDKHSVLGPVTESITTSYDGMPIILKQPEDVKCSVGSKPQFTVEVQPGTDGSTLTYQWQVLEKTQYGSVWTDIEGSEDSSFNPTGKTDGTINDANKYDLNNTVYRCIVTQDTSSGFVNTVTDTVTLTIE